MNVSKKFWIGKNVFITGHTGLKGGWLAYFLHSLGANVSGYSLLPEYSPNFYRITELDRLVNSVIGDVRDLATLTGAMKKAQPEVVFHLAAQPLVRRSYEDPRSTFETNIFGTLNVFESARQVETVKALVNVTSDKCYQNKKLKRGYKEEDHLGGADPYSCSKACAELISSCYQRSFFSVRGNRNLAMATARAGNVIGGGDWSEDRLVPDLVRATVENSPIILRYPDSTRPWQHVLDCISGYLLLAQRLFEEGARYEGPWNFGPDQSNAHSVKSVVEEFSNCWGDKLKWTIAKCPQPLETTLLQLDSSKATSKLMWSPKWNFQASIANTVDWYASYYSKMDMRKITEQQIKNYST